MSKLSRSVLKEIVKECIFEIFTESFLPNDQELVTEQRKTKNRSKSPRRAKTNNVNTRRGLDLISYNSEQKASKPNENFENKINEVTSQLTSDPIMSEIFKDTAYTTLQNQNSAATSKGPSVLTGGDAAARTVHNSDPTNLFSESAGKWAHLAFSDDAK